MAIYLERVGEVRIEEGIIASTKRWVERNERGGGELKSQGSARRMRNCQGKKWARWASG